MKIRVMAAAVLVPLLLIVLLFAPSVLISIILGAVCAIGAYELLSGTGLVKQLRLIIYTVLCAFLVPLWCYFGMSSLWATFGIFVFFALLFAEVLASGGKLPFEKISVCFAGGLLIPYLLSALMRLISMEFGRQLIFIPFILAILSDTGAYFVGRMWGKHKLAPNISPKKSVEGVIGGIAGAVLGMLLYCFILDLAFDAQVNYAFVISYGIIGAFAGMFGDLCFSAIKRQVGIKDYGNLIPGHGGILDRLDSMVVIAPLVEILIQLLPVLE